MGIIAFLSSFLLWGLMSQSKAQVVVTSIDNDVLNYGRKSHQVFSGHVENQGNVKASNIRVIVTWLDMNNNEYEGYTDLGSLDPSESKQFSVVFSSNDLVMVSYYSQRVSFD